VPSHPILLCCLSYEHFITVPGGSIAQDGDKPCKTNACVFEAPEDMDSMHNYEQVNLFGLCVCFVWTYGNALFWLIVCMNYVPCMWWHWYLLKCNSIRKACFLLFQKLFEVNRPIFMTVLKRVISSSVLSVGDLATWSGNWHFSMQFRIVVNCNLQIGVLHNTLSLYVNVFVCCFSVFYWYLVWMVYVVLQVFIKLMRRYKYLEKMFEDEMKKVLMFIKGFSELERIKLARMTALWISNGSVPPTVLLVLINVRINMFVVSYMW